MSATVRDSPKKLPAIISEVEFHEYWIRDYLKPRYPHLVEDFCAALIGYDHIQVTKKIHETALRYVVNAARSHRATLYGTGTRLLANLTINYKEAREAVLEMLTDKDRRTRSNALLCLHLKTPRSLTLRIVRKALSDKSSGVRVRAAYQALSLGIIQLIPEIERQLAIEHLSGAKSQLQFYLSLLREGYSLVPHAEEKAKYSLWVSLPDGMISRSISQDEIDRKGVHSLVAELRSTASSQIGSLRGSARRSKQHPLTTSRRRSR
ncbi:MAG: HEAT repeat domain-containing protein [Anaerolineales bacterium]